MMNNNIDINYMPHNTKALYSLLRNSSFISNYTLVGGSALSVQIKHRISEDLDFIYDEEELNINTIKRNIANIFPDHRIIRQDRKWQIDFVINDVKVTFFSSGSIALPFNVKAYTLQDNNINICSLPVIAVLKMAAIAQRITMRDYYDLYYLRGFLLIPSHQNFQSFS